MKEFDNAKTNRIKNNAIETAKIGASNAIKAARRAEEASSEATTANNKVKLKYDIIIREKNKLYMMKILQQNHHPNPTNK